MELGSAQVESSTDISHWGLSLKPSPSMPGYYRSPADGLAANGEFIGSVAPALLARNFSDQVALDTAAKSLSAPSGKLWVAEIGKGFCPKCHGDWKAPEDGSAEILNGRWELSTMPYARYGRKAPFLETIRVFGGFVSKDGGALQHLARLSREPATRDVAE